MESFTQALGTLKDNVLNTLHITSPPTELHDKLSDVVVQEESERIRRLEQASQSSVDKQNAAELSSVIKGQHFPVLQGVSKGYKRVTIKWEEDERRRRLTNKSECALRRNNANKTARMIQVLGWPLIRSTEEGPEYIVMDSSTFLEEEERQWRLSNAYWSTIAKHNAATVANILRWNDFQRDTTSGSRRYARWLEAKERSYRLQPGTFERLMQNASREAALIRYLGYPFYVQEAERGEIYSQLHKLEEEERRYRLQNTSEEQLAHEVAGIVSQALPLHNEKALEEKERKRRERDVRGQLLARVNAKQVSLMVRESSVNTIAPGPLWFSISRNSMRALEEIERERRLRDFEGQREARSHAREVSTLLLKGLSSSNKPSYISLEEQERQTRILDRAQTNLSMRNARKVSGMIARHFLFSSSSRFYAQAMEESERSRRLQDSTEQRIAKTNARKVANIVSSLHDAPRSAAPSAPAQPLAPAAPAQAALPVRKELPPLPLQEIKVVPTPAPAVTLLDAPCPQLNLASPIYPEHTAPIPLHASSFPVEPLASVELPVAPIAPVTTTTFFEQTTTVVEPVRAAPVEPSGPLAFPGAPVSALPPTVQGTSTPIVPSAAPIAPIAAPISAPLPTTSISSFSTTSSAAPIAPSATLVTPLIPMYNTTTGPSQHQVSYTNLTTSVPAVPVDRYVTGAAPPLGERELRRLEKQAAKHNRKSEKDLRKAEQRMQKAEKMHQKGRDDKAMKLEQKAQHLMQLADHERKWASGLQGEVAHNAPAPASM